MALGPITCRFWRGAPRVWLRELTGFDEQSVRDVSTATAIHLLDRLVELAPEDAWQAVELTAADRDRLLATIYRSTYGQRIDSTSRCTECGSLFDLAFSLDDLIAAVDGTPASQIAVPLPDGTFRTVDGVRFRLPSGEDEIAVAALPPEEAEQALLERCLVEAPMGANTRAAVEEAIEEIAPVLDLDLNTACPECGVRQVVHFDMQFYLLRALEQERAHIAREIHRLATAYGWSLQEILSLRRSERRMFVELIESELLARRRLQ
jgi:hypothetical protein